mmetsp:Transcript_6741/g.9791  ORF Transcript_6741/g.9791 Transcript_6741/m.9791 type:complete len:734 (+) Transcript_6741:125-2326(+)
MYRENKVHPNLSPHATNNSFFKGLIEVEEEVETETDSDYQSDEILLPNKSQQGDDDLEELEKKHNDNRRSVFLGAEIDYPEDKIGSQLLLPKEYQLTYHRQKEKGSTKIKRSLKNCNTKIPLSIKLLCLLVLAGIFIGCIALLLALTGTIAVDRAVNDIKIMKNFKVIDQLHTSFVKEHIHSQTFILTDKSSGATSLSDARKEVNDLLTTFQNNIDDSLSTTITKGREKGAIHLLSTEGFSSDQLTSIRNQVDEDTIASYEVSTYFNRLCHDLQYLYSGVSSSATSGATMASLLSTSTASTLGPILARVYTSALNMTTGASSSIDIPKQIIHVGTLLLEPVLRPIDPDLVNELLAFKNLTPSSSTSSVIDLFNTILSSFSTFSTDLKNTFEQDRQASQQIDIIFLIVAASIIAISLLFAIIFVICCSVIIKKSYNKEEKQTLSIMSKFVPKGYLRLIGVDHIRNAKLGAANRRRLSVMFVDIRSFTSISEKMTAIQTFDFLNDYLSFVGPVIRQYGGYTDKYIGDGIMALFPSAWGSIQAALVMQDGVRRMNKKNKKRSSRFPSNIRIGIGIHTGDCIIGAVGYKDRIDGTLIGDTVNLASRIEGLTKRFGTEILISETTFDDGKRTPKNSPRKKIYHKRYIGKIAPKGKKIGTAMYEILDPAVNRKKIETMDKFNRGMALMLECDFNGAAKCFDGVLKIAPKDAVSELRRIQCDDYKLSDEIWDGIIQVNEK